MQIFPKCKIEERLVKLIEADKNSDKKRIARVSERYYEAKHDILDYKLFYFNADGELVEDTTRSNIKISHPFYTELIDQKVNYLLSNFSINSEDDKLDTELQEYFGDDFKDELADVCEDTSKLGFGYMYSQLNKEFKTRFKYAYSMGVIEVYKEDSDELEAVVYYYIDRIDKSKKTITRIEVHDKDQTFYYVLRGKKLEKDTKKVYNPQPHKTWKEKAKGEIVVKGQGFGYIPFFRLDNNRKQFSDLKPIKKIIDDYDLMNCGLSNNLQDINEGIYVVKGFEGTDFTELQQNLKTKKMVGVSENGDVDIKTIDIPYSARQTKLDIDEKNIYRFGMGINTNALGDNLTNVNIKSRYALLDLKCNKAERKLRKFLKGLIQIALDEINKELKSKYTLKDVNINLDREVITNELDNATIEKTNAERKQIEINTILDIATYLPDEEVIKQICDILDIDYEEIKGDVQEKLESEKIDLAKASDDLLNAPITDENPVEEVANE